MVRILTFSYFFMKNRKYGHCLQESEYDPFSEPVITCEKVTQDMCKDSKWRDTIAVNCPNKWEVIHLVICSFLYFRCGFCLDGGCVDAAVDCDKDPLICKKTAMATFAKANCKRTCGFCATSQYFMSFFLKEPSELLLNDNSNNSRLNDGRYWRNRRSMWGFPSELLKLGAQWILSIQWLHRRSKETVLRKIVWILLE